MNWTKEDTIWLLVVVGLLFLAGVVALWTVFG